MTKKKIEEKPEKKVAVSTVAIKDDLITKIGDKFSGKPNLETLVNDIVENYLACEDAINDIMAISQETSTAAIELEKALAKASKAAEGFRDGFQPVQLEIPQSVTNSEPKQEEEFSAFKKAKVLGRRPARPEDMSNTTPMNPANVRNPNQIAQNTGINPSPRPQTVRVGLGPQKNAPHTAVKPHTVQALDTANAKTPATPVKNLLEGDPSQVPAAVQQQLQQMRTNQSQTITHPTGVIGSDMAKDAMIVPGQGSASM